MLPGICLMDTLTHAHTHAHTTTDNRKVEANKLKREEFFLRCEKLCGVAACDSPVKLANAIWPPSTTSRSVSLNLRPVRYVSRGYILTPYQHTRNPEKLDQPTSQSYTIHTKCINTRFPFFSSSFLKINKIKRRLQRHLTILTTNTRLLIKPII